MKNIFLKNLKKSYPEAKCGLNFKNPIELLVATILSAQCTDKKVNEVTNKLFEYCKNTKDFVTMKLKLLEEFIKPTGFFRVKAKNIKNTIEIIYNKYGGEIPKDINLLISLPGIGKKTANVILGNAYNISSGIVVDTHVSRISQRIGLSQNKTPEKIEKDLIEIVPKKEWIKFSHRMIAHGRQICIARKPKCEICVFNKICEYNK